MMSLRWKEERYLFQSNSGILGFCQVEWYEQGGKHLFVLTEQKENPGMTITNASERIATALVLEGELNPKDCTFVEHLVHEVGEEDYSLVSYSWNKDSYAYNTHWFFLSEQKFQALLLQYE